MSHSTTTRVFDSSLKDVATTEKPDRVLTLRSGLDWLRHTELFLFSNACGNEYKRGRQTGARTRVTSAATLHFI